MSILDLLKENYLYENEDSIELNGTSGLNNYVYVNKEFVIKLINYLDKKLTLEYGTFDDQIGNEIRKYMDESDNKIVKKIKEKIHTIILDEKRKFLIKIQTRMEKFKVPKKKG